MYGATLLYNLRVAELKIGDGEPAGTRTPYARALRDWQKDFLRADAEMVLKQLPQLEGLGAIAHHSIDPRVTSFVKKWADLCLSERDLMLPQTRRRCRQSRLTTGARKNCSPMRT